MHRDRSSLRIALLSAWLGATGCKASAGESCSADDDCEAPLRCASGQCATASPSAAAPSESDPATHVARLSESGRRDEAVDALLRMYEATSAQDQGDATGPHVTALLDTIAGPLAEVAKTGKLDPKRQAAVLAMLARSRHPDAAPVLVAAIGGHRVDAAPPTPVDAVMGEVVSAAADLGLEQTREPIWSLFRGLHASSKKGEIGGFAPALSGAVERLAVPAWEAEAAKMLAAPLDPNGALKAFRDQLFWQRTAARLLGRLRSESAVEPLMRVVLDPQKHDIAPAAIEALASIGAPAAETARLVLAGEHRALGEHAQDRYRNAREKDVADVVDRSADDVRITQSALVLTAVGSASDREAVIDAMTRADAIGRGRIAEALDALPDSEATRKAFQETVADSPLDLPIADEHRGVVALYLAVPRWLDPALAAWLSDLASKLQGTDTGLAPFREAALRSSMVVMDAPQTEAVEALAELITKEKWEADLATAKALLESCKRDAACYLERLDKERSSTASFAATKAAAMAAIHAEKNHTDALVDAVKRTRQTEPRRLLALGLAKLHPGGDPALAKRLETALGVAGTRDPVIAGVIARLRNR